MRFPKATMVPIPSYQLSSMELMTIANDAFGKCTPDRHYKICEYRTKVLGMSIRQSISLTDDELERHVRQLHRLYPRSGNEVTFFPFILSTDIK